MKKSLDNMLLELHSSINEDEVIETLKTIIKSFNISLYKEIILSNPYFKSLIVDIKYEIINEIKVVKEDIESQIGGINNQLSKPISQDTFLKLKDLKRQCIKLLFEIDNRIKDVSLL
jgi:hypothetical protein